MFVGIFLHFFPNPSYNDLLLCQTNQHFYKSQFCVIKPEETYFKKAYKKQTVKNQKHKMKNLNRIFAIFVILFAFAATSFAQVTATATATGTIVTPIAITKTMDMNFGNVAVSTAAGTVVLAPAGTRSNTGGVTLPATAGTVTSASFNITGMAGYTYSITLPSTATTVSSGSNNMTVTTFTSTPSLTGTLTGGISTLKVGATLNVGPSQAAGTYTSATPFSVTVNYN